MSNVATIVDLAREFEFCLFNPNPEVKSVSYDGRFYNLPPVSEHWRDPKTGAVWPEPGVMPVKGYSDIRTDARGNITKNEITARDIVEHIVGTDGVSGKMGRAGVRLLFPGDSAQNEAIKRDALIDSMNKRYEDAQATIKSFKREVEKAIEQKQPAPRPGPRQREAYAFVAKMDLEGGVGFSFSCPECNEGFAKEQSLREHIGYIHRHAAAALLKAAGLEVEQAEPEPVEPEPVAVPKPPTPIKRGRIAAA